MIITNKIYFIYKEPQQRERITEYTGNVLTHVYSFPLTIHAFVLLVLDVS